MSMTDRERERAETGEFDDRIPLERVRDVFDDLEDSAEPLDAGQVADRADIARRTAHNKLGDLVDDGDLRTRKVGARGRVWWVPHVDGGDKGPGNVSGPFDSDAGREGAQSPADSVGDRRDQLDPADTPTDDADSGGLETTLEATLPGSGALLDRRVETVLELYERIRDADGEIVTTGELKDAADPDAVGYQSVDSFWTNAIKKNSAQERPNSLTVLPGLEELGNGRYCYQPEQGDDDE